MHIFHTWSNWTIYTKKEYTTDYGSVRRVSQKRTCSVCGLTQFKTNEFDV